MRKVKIAILFLFLFLFSFYLFSQEYKNPFSSLLPETRPSSPSQGPAKDKVTLQVTIEGIIWNTSLPQVIIEGEIYKEGDTLKSVDAKIIKIREGKVHILYGGRVHILGTTRKTQ